MEGAARMRRTWPAAAITICMVCAIAISGCGSGGGDSAGYGGGDGGSGSGGGGTTAGTPALTSVNNLSSSGQPIRPGDWIEVSGSNFGATQQNSYVGFTNGATTTQAALYSSWSDTKIVCRVPEGTPMSDRYAVKEITNIFVTINGAGTSNGYSAASNPTPNPSPENTPPSPTPSPTTTTTSSPTPTPTSTTSPTPTPAPSPASGGGGGGGAIVLNLGFTVQPTDVKAGDAIAPAIKVSVRDASGNTVTTATDEITIAVDSGGTGAVLSGTLKQKAVNGVATFEDLSVNIAGSNYTLTATSGTFTAATSGAFKVSHGAAAGLSFDVQPQAGTAGETLSPIVVHVVDSRGNLVDDDTGTKITLQLGSTHPAGANLTGGDETTATGGIATFSAANSNGVKLDRTGTYTLNAHSTLADKESDGAGFSISAAGAYEPAFIKQPSDPPPALPATVKAGQNIPDPFVTVGVYDNLGNLRTNDSTTVVKLEIAAGPAGAKISGGSFINATVDKGIATFSSASFDNAGDYTLGASFTGSPTATSTLFSVTHSDAKKLVFTVNPPAPPATLESGAVITPEVKVEVHDQYDNLVNDGADSTASVTLSINNGGALGGTNPKNASGGVATFDDLTVIPPGTGYILTASSGSLTAATGSAFDMAGVKSYSSGPGPSNPVKMSGGNVNFMPNGDAGTKVVIVGINFGATQGTGTVTFKGATGAEKPATPSGGGWTDTSIECTVPSVSKNPNDLNIGTGEVTVTRADATAYSKPFVICPDGLTYVPAGTQGGGDINAFYMGECEVTKGEIDVPEFNNNQPFFGGYLEAKYVDVHSNYFTASDSLPAEQVSWYLAVLYCNYRSEKEGITRYYTVTNSGEWNAPTVGLNPGGSKGYRLGNSSGGDITGGNTSQSEWEYACRAGTATDYYWGALLSEGAPYTGWDYLWFNSNSDPDNDGTHSTQIVGQKIPNLWGLYDMSGSVNEWCNEYFKYMNYFDYRVVRGGCWNSSSGDCLSSDWFPCSPKPRMSINGFRLVRTK